jgi:hypothetical protein
MKTCVLWLSFSAVTASAGGVFAQPGSGSAGSAAGSGSDSGGGSGSANAPAPTPPAPAPPQDFPMPAGVKPTKVCLDEMDKDPGFADWVIKRAEFKLKDKLNAEQVLKDVCTMNTHAQAQTDVATNYRHVIMAYIAMWLMAAGFVLFLWRKHQALKIEIAQLRRDLDAATKDTK